MGTMQTYPYVIVGAGVSGLALAYRLASAGKRVLVIERDKKVGGLAKSFRYKTAGKSYIFDVGPKRFHTDDAEVLALLHEVLPNNLLTIGRASSVYFLGRYFNWPIIPSDLLKLPPGVQLRIGMDVLGKLLMPNQPNTTSFTDEIKAKYGRTLYESFFSGYTEKFIRIPANQVHKDWATTGVNRSIIDPKAKGNSIWELIQAVLIPKPITTKFLYPKAGGFGQLTDTLAGLIRRHGGTIATNTTITKLNYTKHTASLSNGKTVRFGTLIWSGNLHALASLLSLSFSHITYLSTVFYQILVKGNTTRKDQWIYFADRDISFVRATIPKNIARYKTPRGYSTIMLEVTCLQGDKQWSNPRTMRAQLGHDLVRTGLIKQDKDIIKIHTQRIADTYPVYTLDYAKGFAQASRMVHTQFPNIRLLGRSGTFWYNNSDHSIKAALGMAKFLLGRSKNLPDIRSIFSNESVSKT